MEDGMQRLLVSVRGRAEALVAARGGATIVDVEYPASALGTPYPLNIDATRKALDSARFRHVFVSTNIGERQHERANAPELPISVSIFRSSIFRDAEWMFQWGFPTTAASGQNPSLQAEAVILLSMWKTVGWQQALT